MNYTSADSHDSLRQETVRIGESDKTVAGTDRTTRFLFAVATGLAMLLPAAPDDGFAQDIEPRVMSAAPAGTSIAGLTLSYSSGELLFDRTIPVKEVDGKITVLAPSYSRYLNFFGVTSRIDAVIPFVHGDWEGALVGEDGERSVSRSGIGDPRLSLAVFVLGARAMTLEEFRQYKQRTMLGLFLRVTIPIGEYDDQRAVNLGSNRWQLVPALAVSHRWSRLIVEAYTGMWIFSDNEEQYGGNTLSQDPLFAFHLNLVYSFRPRLWLSAGTRQTVGGQTQLNGVERDDERVNNRLGLVLGVPVSDHHTLKIFGTTGTRSTVGDDFDTFGLQWFYQW